jgi:hypothetical protein
LKLCPGHEIVVDNEDERCPFCLIAELRAKVKLLEADSTKSELYVKLHDQLMETEAELRTAQALVVKLKAMYFTSRY